MQPSCIKIMAITTIIAIKDNYPYKTKKRDLMKIITIVSKVDTSALAQWKDMIPVSVAADAENSSNTLAYQTVSCGTTNAPILISDG